MFQCVQGVLMGAAPQLCISFPLFHDSFRSYLERKYSKQKYSNEKT